MTRPQRNGEQRKNEALDLLAERRKPYVLRGRRALLATLLEHGTGSTDDVRAAVRLPPGIDPACFGAVGGYFARLGIVERVAYLPTRRAVAHGRPVSVWRLVDPAGARRWLDEHPDEPDPVDEKAQRWLPLGDGPKPGEAQAHDTAS